MRTGRPLRRGSGEILKREEFEQRKQMAELAKRERYSRRPRVLVSQGKSVDHSPFLKALAMRCMADEAPMECFAMPFGTVQARGCMRCDAETAG